MRYLRSSEMKKVALIFLIIIYSMSAFGVAFKEFYCCGKLKSITVVLTDVKEDKCTKGESDDGCCKTTYQYLKVKDSHLVAADVTAPLSFSTDLHTPALPLQVFFFTTNHVDVINGSHAPPLHRDVPIYISNSVFRI
jgi:hypothetical protein